MNKYYDKVFNSNHELKIHTLYDVGEQNLTDDDVVVIDGVECYLLEMIDGNAKFITKNIYNQSFINDKNEIDNATNNIFEYLDKFYDMHFNMNPYLQDYSSSYLFNYYPVKLKQKLFLLNKEEAMLYSNGYSIGKDKFNTSSTHRENEYAGFIIAEFERNDKYQYASMITYYGNLQPGYIYDNKIGVRPLFILSLQ